MGNVNDVFPFVIWHDPLLASSLRTLCYAVTGIKAPGAKLQDDCVRTDGSPERPRDKHIALFPLTKLRFVYLLDNPALITLCAVTTEVGSSVT
jgi:hypothetical protein